MRPIEYTIKEYQERLDTDTMEKTDLSELSGIHEDKVLQKIYVLFPTTVTWAEKIVHFIKESEKVVIDKNKKSIVGGTAKGVKVPIFLNDLKQPTQKLNNSFF